MEWRVDSRVDWRVEWWVDLRVDGRVGWPSSDHRTGPAPGRLLLAVPPHSCLGCSVLHSHAIPDFFIMLFFFPFPLFMVT